jgi:hypothetical protein
MTILLWGLPDDPPMAAVKNALDILGSPYFFLDQREVSETHVRFHVGHTMSGTLRSNGATIHLEDVTGVYLRPHDTRRLQDVAQAGENSPLWRHALRVDEILLSWADLTPAAVINRPSAASSNSSKPYQAALIRDHGFDVPDTLITTSSAALERLRIQHDQIIFKSISGVRSIVSRFASTDSARLADLRWCPTQFQQCIVGRDYRIHVVGNDVYACEILSQADDYRYAARSGLAAEVRSATIPNAIVARCRSVTLALGLLFAGIDLRLANDGHWFCFEANPSPGFTFYETATGQPLALAVARLLSSTHNMNGISDPVKHKRKSRGTPTLHVQLETTH